MSDFVLTYQHIKDCYSHLDELGQSIYFGMIDCYEKLGNPPEETLDLMAAHTVKAADK